MYNKNAEIYNYGKKIGEIEAIRIEDLFDDGLAYMCEVRVKAIYNDTVTSFILVPDIDLYVVRNQKKLDADESPKVDECSTDRKDYKFYEITFYDEDGEIDEKHHLASFPAGTKRRFGSARFRTIKDAIIYIKSGKELDTDKMIWKDNDGNEYSIDELYDLPTTSILFTMNLNNYSIFDRNEMCVFSREN